MECRYVTIDVFTDRTFGGNPVAVVLVVKIIRLSPSPPRACQRAGGDRPPSEILNAREHSYSSPAAPR
jgi:hypothetical protein